MEILLHSKKNMKINIITYGCTANQGDSHLMQSVLEKAGHEITGSLEDADYVIVNTCAVKEATENKIISRLSKLSKTGKKIIIGGCLTKINLNRIKKSVPGFSGILDTRSIESLPEIIEKSENGEKNQVIFSEKSPIKPRLAKLATGLSGIIQISEGCDLSCTYCATTLARGDLQCFSPEDIVRGASSLIREGAKEILLTSQDNGAYLYNKKQLPELLTELCKIGSEFFIRNGMTNPMYLNSILNPLVEAYRNPKIYKFLHIPIQSGSDKVLADMKRGYKADNFRKFAREFRKVFEKLTLSTDVIVGFPTETKEDFNKTIDLAKEIRFDIVNISKFGPRPGTEASMMKQIDKKTVNKRSSELSRIAEKISLEKNKEFIGWSGMVFISGLAGQKIKPNPSHHNLVQIGNINSNIFQAKSEKEFRGGNIFYKPVSIKTDKDILGKVVKVKIIGSTQALLTGELL